MYNWHMVCVHKWNIAQRHGYCKKALERVNEIGEGHIQVKCILNRK